MELNQLAVGNNGKGIRVEDYPKVIAQLNAGLTALHTRFALNEKEIIIQQYPQISVYYLRTEFAQTNTSSTEPIKYLMDTDRAPFKGRVLKITQVFNEGGCPIPLNDEPMCNSVFMPSYDSIQVSSPLDCNALFVLYRADHDEIPISTTDLNIELRIPNSHLKALSYYIAAQFYGSVPSLDATNKGVEWLTKYENECIRIEQYDLNNQEIQVTNTKPERRGWV